MYRTKQVLEAEGFVEITDPLITKEEIAWGHHEVGNLTAKGVEAEVGVVGGINFNNYAYPQIAVFRQPTFTTRLEVGF